MGNERCASALFNHKYFIGTRQTYRFYLYPIFCSIRSLGSAALTLCYVAMGAIEAYHVESIDSWDVAAGQLIIEEAGGTIIDTLGNYSFQ